MYRQRIRENYDRLSKSQKRIADFLMTSHRDAAFMTASRLAGVLEVDVATITRFAQRLKYPGYPELLDEVRHLVQAEMSEGLRPVEGASEAGQVFVRTLTAQLDNVERTLAGISMDAVEKALVALARARTIYVLGQHTAILLAEKLTLFIRVMGLDAVTVGGDAVQVALALRNMQAADVVLGIGFSGYATEVAGAMQLARRRGATTIAISGSDVSPVARMGDIVLICSAASSSHLPSEVAATAVIESIGHALAAEREEVFARNLHSLGETFQALAAQRDHPVGSIEESIMKLY